MPQPLQREDIARVCATRGVTLDQFADELLYVQCQGVPLDRIGLVSRAWQLVSALLDERLSLDLAENYTVLDVCPHCGTPPRTTGGKHPVTYCPHCDATLCDVKQFGGQVYRRWSTSSRPFIRQTERKHDNAVTFPCQAGGKDK